MVGVGTASMSVSEFEYATEPGLEPVSGLGFGVVRASSEPLVVEDSTEQALMASVPLPGALIARSLVASLSRLALVFGQGS